MKNKESDFQKQIKKMDKQMVNWKITIINNLANIKEVRSNGYRFYWVVLDNEITSKQIKRLNEKRIYLACRYQDNNNFIHLVKCGEKLEKEIE